MSLSRDLSVCSIRMFWTTHKTLVLTLHGSLYNPTNAAVDNPGCGPSNTTACRVGDLSAKLGYVTINIDTTYLTRDWKPELLQRNIREQSSL